MHCGAYPSQFVSVHDPHRLPRHIVVHPSVHPGGWYHLHPTMGLSTAQWLHPATRRLRRGSRFLTGCPLETRRENLFFSLLLKTKLNMVSEQVRRSSSIYSNLHFVGATGCLAQTCKNAYVQGGSHKLCHTLICKQGLGVSHSTCSSKLGPFSDKHGLMQDLVWIENDKDKR